MRIRAKVRIKANVMERREERERGEKEERHQEEMSWALVVESSSSAVPVAKRSGHKSLHCINHTAR